MAEVWGHRSLLGVGVVLAWLLLFHLLVNIWLLCVFTSLLLVLGGWLGSQTVLESNSVIHLERFITWEQIPKSEKDEDDLDQEIHNTVKKIIRDFVSSWYSTVSSESAFETEIEEAMISMAMRLKLRARTADRKELTQRVLELFGCHLQDYIQAKALVTEQQGSLTAQRSSENEQLWEAYSSISAPHLAMTGETVEVNYVRAVTDLLLHILVPSPHLETHTGRFVVGELITCNVLLPLVAKLSDPDWLNLLILKIAVSQQQPEAAQSPNSSPLLPSPPNDSEVAPVPQTTQAPQKNSDVPPQSAEAETINHTETATPTPTAFDVPDSAEVDFPQYSAEEDESVRPFLRRYTRGSKSNPFYQENDSDPDSPLADFKRSSSDSLVMIGRDDGLDDSRKDCATSVETNNGLDLEDVCHSPVDGQPKFLLSSESVEHTNGCVPSSVSTTEGGPGASRLHSLEREGSSPSINANRDLLMGVEQTGMVNPSELSVVSTLQCCSSVPTFSFEPLSSPEGPVIIQNLRITGTITAKEHRGTGSHPYTLYTIKYETAVACENSGSIQPGFEDVETIQTGCENPSSAQSVAYHMVNRRYSEFLNLQTRLEEKPDLRKLVKGVKGPKKIFPDMPFGNMDSDKIEARKGLLETFLKQLCAIPEIANSEEMQEFLALNTDARIAFVKKPFIVSRIDKIVVNAIVDTLKTAFPRSEPQSPTEDNETEADGGKLGADKKTRSRLKFSSKNVPCMNGSDMRPPVLFSMEQTSTMFNGMPLGYLQAFINDQEKQTMKCDSRACAGLAECGGLDLDDRKSPDHGLSSECEMMLAEGALNILCLLMKEQWSWLCMENIQKTIRLVFGTLINRWLDVSVSNLTCTRYWVVYLQVIQEAVWPGGVLPAAPVFERSQQQKDDTKQQALHCLMRLLPALVSDVLGSEKYRLSWQTVLEAFQDPHINRHLVYCILDLLLEFLVPEIPEENFQKSLLQTLSKNPEKLLA